MIRIDGMTFGYRGRRVYDGLSMELGGRGVYGLLGRNGAGKTTLMKLIAGLLRCDGGTVSVDGAVSSMRRAEFLDRIYYLPESLSVPDMTVAGFASAYGEFYSGYDKSFMTECLRVFDVSPKSRLAGLSFGQKKKAFISFALSLNVPLLLLDEPGNGLDIPSRISLRRLLSEYSVRERMVVVSTHQVRDVADIMDHVVVIDAGRLLLDVPMDVVAGKLDFVVSPEPSDKAVYSERVAGGYVHVVGRTAGSCGKGNVDVEILFNACLAVGRQFADLFRTDAADSNGRNGKEVCHER